MISFLVISECRLNNCCSTHSFHAFKCAYTFAFRRRNILNDSWTVCLHLVDKERGLHYRLPILRVDRESITCQQVIDKP